jgi:large subunit ribosomal protein L29
VTVDVKNLRDLGLEELQEKYLQYKEELFNLRFQNAIGQLKNTSRIKVVRKTIARVLTVVGERERARAGGTTGRRV